MENENEEESSDEEELEEDDEGEETGGEELAGNFGLDQHGRLGDEVPAASKKRLHVSLAGNKKDLLCHVCGERGHKAGFVGATYLDCPNKPCYLCKEKGHTTATCPHRLAPGHGCTPAASNRSPNLLTAVTEREQGGRSVEPRRLSRAPVPPGRWQVSAAILKVHTRRCCCVEFHPHKDNLVVSGDKKGHIAIWNYEEVHERTTYSDIHFGLVNTIAFLPWYDSMSCCTASSDGTAKVFDIETGANKKLLDLNPEGWIEGVTKVWHMAYGCDTNPHLHLIMVGDTRGVVHLLDPRAAAPVNSLQLHRKGNKVVSVSINKCQPALVLTAGNDHSARLFDVRGLSSSLSSVPDKDAPPSGPGPSQTSVARGARGLTRSGPGPGAGLSTSASGAPLTMSHAELAVLAHPKVVNSAYFSPLTGTKILTTCQDNRLRVWDNLLTGHQPPDREIVHSHDRNRYLSPFKAEWDPKDITERTAVIGRYISEDFGGVALHPVDVLDVSTGQLMHELIDSNLTTISPINKPHPRRDLIVSGSSRSLYLWSPMDEEDDMEGVGTSIRPPASQGGGLALDAFSPARSSARFVFYDADPGSGKKGTGSSGKKRKAKGKAAKSRGGDNDDADDDSEDD